MEGREKFERHCIASKLISTKGGDCGVNEKVNIYLEGIMQCN